MSDTEIQEINKEIKTDYFYSVNGMVLGNKLENLTYSAKTFLVEDLNWLKEKHPNRFGLIEILQKMLYDKFIYAPSTMFKHLKEDLATFLGGYESEQRPFIAFIVDFLSLENKMSKFLDLFWSCDCGKTNDGSLICYDGYYYHISNDDVIAITAKIDHTAYFTDSGNKLTFNTRVFVRHSDAPDIRANTCDLFKSRKFAIKELLRRRNSIISKMAQRNIEIFDMLGE